MAHFIDGAHLYAVRLTLGQTCQDVMPCSWLRRRKSTRHANEGASRTISPYFVQQESHSADMARRLPLQSDFTSGVGPWQALQQLRLIS